MLWVKAFHLITIITWFAALFYLPRLFVYHASSEDAISNERFKVMERKLYRGIMTPSLVLVIVTGGWLLSFYDPQQLADMVWLHAKLTLVAALVAYHFVCRWHLKQFTEDRNARSHVYFRWFNEAPVVGLVAIVILAVVKPF